jgi:hypothetical protein
MPPIQSRLLETHAPDAAAQATSNATDKYRMKQLLVRDTKIAGNRLNRTIGLKKRDSVSKKKKRNA